jgi:hypothetical protein
MTVAPNPRLAELQAFLVSSDQQDQELRAVIASDLTSSEDRMQALLELAHLSSDLTALLLEVIMAEPKYPSNAPRRRYPAMGQSRSDGGHIEFVPE